MDRGLIRGPFFITDSNLNLVAQMGISSNWKQVDGLLAI
jgi:hypothetical protein